jgi:hypothetical protein
MRMFILLLLFPVIVSARSGPAVPTGPSPLQHFSIQPLEILTSHAKPGQIQGEFIVKSSPQAQTGLPTGGACLIRQFAVAKGCVTHAGCDVQTPGPATVHGYCVAAHGALRGTNSKSCWYKPPGDDKVMCNKSPVAPLPPNVPLYTPWVAVGDRLPVDWRVATCQNLVPLGCKKDNAVEGKDFINTFGNVRHFPAR